MPASLPAPARKLPPGGQFWPNTPELFAATVTSYASRHLPEVPDTGTLYGDLLQYATAYADMVNTPTGRRLLDSQIVRPSDWDLAGAREEYFSSRHRWAAAIVARGIDRGECSPATDPGRTIDTLTFTVCLPVLIYDRPITVDDCEYAVALVVRGISCCDRFSSAIGCREGKPRLNSTD